MKDAKLIFLKQEKHILSLLLEDGKLLEANAYPLPASGADAAAAPDQAQLPCSLGSIYVGKVNHVVKNINAAFLELAGGQRAFLSLDNRKAPRLLNRTYDGRLLAGDEVLVQVEKEAVKTKDPVVTAELSFSGRYAVLLPSFRPGRLVFSGKLESSRKKELKDWLERKDIQAVLERATVIIRTNASELAEAEPLALDILRLDALAAKILSVAGSRTCRSCLYRPDSAYLTEIRDTYHDQYEAILTDAPDLYEEVKQFLAQQCPGELHKLKLYQDSQVTLMNLYGLSAKLKEATETRVWLKSGGYLVIEPTEALTVIDVNTGKYSGKKAVRETFRLINLEAAAEIARQLRLRNLSGIILVDFINMEASEDKQELLQALSRELRQDPVKAVVVDMTPLGLVEITRKKIRRPLREQLGIE